MYILPFIPVSLQSSIQFHLGYSNHISFHAEHKTGKTVFTIERGHSGFIDIMICKGCLN